MKTTPVLIAIVDDHTLFRKGVAGLMGEFEELKVVFEAENGVHMQEMLVKHASPDVILMDINMPFLDGYKTTAWLKVHYPKIKVLALSMYEDDKAVLGMIKAGASGYVLKESKPKEVLEAIMTIFTKGVYLNELVSGKLIRSFAGNELSVNLSNKEVEFLKLSCSELTYKEIAEKLCISPRTVDNYRESLFMKLNLKSRTGLVLYAIQHGIFKF